MHVIGIIICMIRYDAVGWGLGDRVALMSLSDTIGHGSHTWHGCVLPPCVPKQLYRMHLLRLGSMLFTGGRGIPVPKQRDRSDLLEMLVAFGALVLVRPLHCCCCTHTQSSRNCSPVISTRCCKCFHPPLSSCLRIRLSVNLAYW